MIGSWKNAVMTAKLYRVNSNNPDNLELINTYYYYTEFVSLRNKIAELLSEVI